MEHVVEIIEYEKDKIKAEAKQEIEHRINEALEIAENIYIRYKGERKDAEIKKMIVNTLKPVRFDNDKNMYFIKDADGVPILNMEPRYRDLNFKKTGNAEQSVFRIFRPFNWYIGTAVSPAAIRKNTQEQLKKYIGKIIIDPNHNLRPIGVNIERLHWADAFELVLKAHDLIYDEFQDYIFQTMLHKVDLWKFLHHQC